MVGVKGCEAEAGAGEEPVGSPASAVIPASLTRLLPSTGASGDFGIGSSMAGLSCQHCRRERQAQPGKGLPGWYPPVRQLAGQVRVVGNSHGAALPPQVQRLVEDERHGDAECRPAGRAEEL